MKLHKIIIPIFFTLFLFNSTKGYSDGTSGMNTENIHKVEQTTENNIINQEPKDEILVKVKYENTPPNTIPFIEKYKEKKSDKIYYGIIMAEKANLREKPLANSKLLKILSFYERVQLLEEVEFKGQDWYKVATSQGEIGYLYSPYITKRIFQFEKGLEKIEKVESFINEALRNEEPLALINAYIPDSENNFLSKKKDKYGVYQLQSSEGKYNNETLYIPDRSITKILNSKNNKKIIKVEAMSEEAIEVPAKDVVYAERLENKPINKAIVVDVSNQNLILYEKINEKWSIISYAYSKTGYESNLGFETPKGTYLLDLAKEKMLYTGIDGKVQGAANNALRFSGGGYLHGTPLSLDEFSQKDSILQFREGYLGTFSGTRKCIRTTKDHALFIYSWVFNKNLKDKLPTYETIKDNILFIVY